eukprot:TRINITY_DN4895_c0_g1_i1.p2 TRINITY_DN4895_c0_g1~~TRINITY_DN4895_c0_g1_i1.p2  ORF type:complete len:427 (-),score=144.01 TRINITY_DN4895_c0_g1_i1:50-1330(-)
MREHGHETSRATFSSSSSIRLLALLLLVVLIALLLDLRLSEGVSHRVRLLLLGSVTGSNTAPLKRDRIAEFYDGAALQRDTMAGQLFAALDALQNPPNCSTGRLLVKTGFAEYGFGMNMHQLAQNLVVCQEANRTLVTAPSFFRYAPLPDCPDRTPDCFFENISSCRKDDAADASPLWFNPGELRTLARSGRRAVTFAYNDADGAQAFLSEYRQHYRLAIDDGAAAADAYADHSRRQAALYGVPRWYWCHVVAYVFRPNAVLRQLVQERLDATGYGSDDFTIGLQVRGGNKVDDKQAGFVSLPLQPYVDLIDAWLRRQPAYVPGRSTVGVYLMTDEPKVLAAASSFPDYRFMVRPALDTRTEHTGSAVTFNETVVIATDILLTAAADFFVGAYWSNMGRLVRALLPRAIHAPFMRPFMLWLRCAQR